MSVSRPNQIRVLAQRELDAVVRTRTYLVLVVLFGVAILSIPALGGAGGYLPLVLNLTTPVELLVPVLAFAFGYQAVRTDAERGELDVVRTYPVDRATYVIGVFLGRSATLLPTVLVPLTLAAAFVPLTSQPTPSFLASAATVDDPLYYVRFVVLATAYALVTLGIALGVSSVARSRRHGLALTVTTLLILVLGLDIAVIGGIATAVVNPDGLGTVLMISPASSFRGLVLAFAATPIEGVSVPAPTVLPAIIGLVVWLVGALSLATVAVWRA